MIKADFIGGAMPAEPLHHRLRHSNSLDGLRGVAVLAVLAYHASSLAPGGWLGVDVFFVLSGYLITRLLLDEYAATGRVNLRAFYWRRVLRLGPALALALVLSIPLMFIYPDRELGHSPTVVVFAVLGYVGNWLNVVNPVSLGPLTHTWSLAIEEQFYIVWPLVLVALCRRRGSASVARWCVAGIVCIALSRATLLLWASPEQLWFATTSRADALLVGALAGCMAASARHVPPRQALALAAAVALGLHVLIVPEAHPTMLLGGLTVIAALTGVIILDSGGPLLRRVLSIAPLRAVGKVSYGLYLYHYPVFFLANSAVDLTSAERWTVKIGGTTLIVVGSWFLLERPLLRFRDRVKR